MKNDNTSKLIDKILHESSLDSRIETGIFDIHNYDHMEIMAEHMAEAGVDKKIIAEVINELVMDEGKYPERQAFNKEGWLVTFPSKQYRDVALKKGTHSIADPTHGKGGMNLYYKKKGKQQRQTQQDPTQTDTQQSPVPQEPAPPVSPPQPSDDFSGDDDDENAHAQDRADSIAARAAAEEMWAANAAKKSGAKNTDAATPQSALPAAGAPAATQAPAAGQAPAPVAPPPAPVAPDYAKPSKQFAMEKGWKATPYGEWRDKQGNTKAVTGVSGEVVPLENVYRDELKLFVQKNAPAPVAPPPEAPLPPA
jgi:hypothetical protein